MNQLTIQTKESQDRVNSLNDSRDFHDLETASSSRSFHVPRHPSIVPSIFGKLCSGSSLSQGTCVACQDFFFVDRSAPDEPTASNLGNVYARSPTATYGELVFSSAGTPVARIDETSKDTQSFTIPTPRFA